jgi:hypothetical protein
MKQGCFFNPRPSPGRCIKDVQSAKIDKECEIVSEICRLKTNISQNKEIIEQSHKHTDKISGPISAYSTKIEKSYNFFGDAHFSMERTCSPCKDINISSLKLVTPNGSDNCWDISVLLSEIFTQASKENKWIDFYIEIPFLSGNNFRPSQKDIEKGIDQFGYLYKLYYIFYNCLNKINCQYDTTRIHYVDIRLEYQKVSLPEITKELKNLIIMSQQRVPLKYETNINLYESYISINRVGNSMDKLLEMVGTDKRKRNLYIEETDKLMRDLYFSGGQNMSGKIEPKNFRLFKLYLLSDNFAKEASDLIELNHISSNNELLILKDHLVPPTMMVNRKGKNMHRIRAQLLALEEEGKKDLALKIYDFIISEYLKKVDNSTIIDLWRGIMITYDGFINAKYRSLDDLQSLIYKFSQEFEKINQIQSFTVTGISLLMDAYTLARMFRTYPDKSHIDSVKTIIYAGDAHITTYVNFFENILKADFEKYNPNKNLLENYDKLIRCLDVDISKFRNI